MASNFQSVYPERLSGSIKAKEISYGSIFQSELNIFKSFPKVNTKAVTSLALSEDGKFLVSGSEDGSVYLWDMKGKKQIQMDIKENEQSNSWTKHKNKINCVGISFNGNLIASGSLEGNILNVYSNSLGTITTLDRPGILSVIISKIDTHIISASSIEIIIWNYSLRNIEKKIEMQNIKINSFALSTNESFIITSLTNDTLKLWNLQDHYSPKDLQAHSKPLITICIRENMKTVASISEDGNIKIWSIKNMKEILEMNLETTVNAAKFSLDKQHAICIIQDQIKVYNIISKELIEIMPIVANIKSLAFSYTGEIIVGGLADGIISVKYLRNKREQKTIFIEHAVYSLVLYKQYLCIGTGLTDCTIIIYNTLTNKKIHQLEEHTSWIYSLTISDDGKYLVSGSGDKKVKIWDFEKIISIDEGKEIENGILPINELKIESIKTLKIHTKVVRSVLFIPKSHTFISCSQDGYVKMYDIQTDKEKNLQMHLNEVYCLSISEDRKYIASGSKDNTVRVWDIPKERKKMILNDHPAAIYAVIITTNNKYILSGLENGDVFIWDFNTKRKIQELKKFHAERVRSFLLLDEDFVITASKDKLVRIFSLENPKRKCRLIGHCQEICSLAFDKDTKTLFSGSSDKTVKVWNFGQRVKTLEQKQSNFITSVAVCHKNQIVACGTEDKKVSIRRIENTEKEMHYWEHTDTVNSIVISFDGKFIVSGSSDNIIKVWNIIGWKFHREFDHKSPVYAVGISNDSQYVISGADDKKLILWSIEGNNSKIFEGHTDCINAVAISPKSNFIVSGSSDKMILLWKINDEKNHLTFEGHKESVTSVKITPDEQFIASGSRDFSIKVWNIADNTLFYTLEKFNINKPEIVLQGHEDEITCIEITNDQKYIVSASADKTIKIWNLLQKKLVYTIKEHSDKVNSVAISNDGMHIISSSNDIIKIFNMRSIHDELFYIEKPSDYIYNIIDRMGSFEINHFIKKTNEFNEILSYNSNTQDLGINKNSIPDALEIMHTNDSQFQLFYINSCLRGILQKHGINNILNNSLWGANGIFDVYVQTPLNFYSLIDALENEDFSCINSDSNGIVFTQYQYTLIHILCFLGLDTELSLISPDNFVLNSDIFGKSPFFYSIIQGNKECTDALLQLLASIENEENFRASAVSITDDFSMIIRDSSNNLHLLLRRIFIKSQVMHGYIKPYISSFSENMLLGRFIKPSLPIFYRTNYSSFQTSKYIDEEKRLNMNKIAYRNYTSVLIFVPEKSSIQSIELLEAIISCTNDEIFNTLLIQSFIKYQWNRIRIWNVLLALLAILNVVTFLLFNHYDTYSRTVIIIFITTNVLLLIIKFLEFFSSGARFNLRTSDFIRSIITCIWIIMKLNGKDEIILTWLTGIAIMIKGSSLFKSISGTRRYVQLVTQALIDIRYFLVVFCYSNFFFGVLYYIARRDEISFQALWINPYGLNFGNNPTDADPENYTLVYIIYVCATMIDVILMLNLLISILGNTYGNFKSREDIIDYRAIAEMILKIQRIHIWKKKFSRKMYFHAIEAIAIKDSSEDIVVQQQGKDTESIQLALDEKIGPIQKKLEEMDKDMQLMSRNINLILEKLDAKA